MSVVSPLNIPALSDDVVISARGVSKKFCRNLRRSMLYGVRDLARNICGIGAARIQAGTSGLRRDEFWALTDIGFELRRGETLGLIGVNGSGKSTLLRMLTGIFPPDEGLIMVRGRVGALIALGAGFHPHMTGRENLYLNGAILGMRRDEIDERFDDIVRFAELGDFLDAPVSTYSSGMAARLGFSIAAHVNPDIMLVDEVLSVGDMAFRLKCRERMQEFVDNGGVVVFVSHEMNAVQSLCQRVLWLQDGRMHQDGPASSVIGQYLEAVDRKRLDSTLDDIRRTDAGTGDIKISKVVTRRLDGRETQEFITGDAMVVELHLESARAISNPYFWVGIVGQFGPVMAANMLFDGCRPERIEKGKSILKCTFRTLPLMPQSYTLRAGIRSEDGASFLVESRQVAAFRVVGDVREIGFRSPVAESMTRDSYPVLLPYEWELPDGVRHAKQFAFVKEGRFGDVSEKRTT